MIKTNRTLSYIVATLFLLIAAFLAYRSMSTNSLVAMIGIDRPGIPEQQCNIGLSQFSAYDSCDNNGFSHFTYVCDSTSTEHSIFENRCVSFDQAYTQAISMCRSSCKVSPTQKASSTPIATPQLHRSPLPTVRATIIPRSTDHPTIPEKTPLPDGCHLEQVQCFRAPCNPIMVCNSETSVEVPQSPTTPPRSSWSRFGCRLGCLSRVGRNWGQCMTLCN